jgi:uncharacterized protein involved in tolerance to divalent cations
MSDDVKEYSIEHFLFECPQFVELPLELRKEKYNQWLNNKYVAIHSNP